MDERRAREPLDAEDHFLGGLSLRDEKKSLSSRPTMRAMS